jgi:DegV family protein with EDD domain
VFEENQEEPSVKPSKTVAPRFAIVTDSACDLPYEYYAAHDVALVPMHVRLDGADLLDQVDVSPADYYVRLACTKSNPTTSYPSPAEILDVYQRLIDEGAPAIVSVHVSSGVSGTVTSAKTAAREASKSVRCEVVDTRLASAAEGLVVAALVSARDRGASVDEALARAEQVMRATDLYFILPAGHQMVWRRGAAIGLRRLMAAMFGVRPLLYLDEDGSITERSSSTDLADSTGLIARIMSRTAQSEGPLRYVEISAGLPRALDALEKPLDTNEFVSSRMAVANAGAAVVSRAGLGSVGIAFVPESVLSDGEWPYESDVTSASHEPEA